MLAATSECVFVRCKFNICKLKKDLQATMSIILDLINWRIWGLWFKFYRLRKHNLMYCCFPRLESLVLVNIAFSSLPLWFPSSGMKFESGSYSTALVSDREQSRIVITIIFVVWCFRRSERQVPQRKVLITTSSMIEWSSLFCWGWRLLMELVYMLLLMTEVSMGRSRVLGLACIWQGRHRLGATETSKDMWVGDWFGASNRARLCLDSQLAQSFQTRWVI